MNWIRYACLAFCIFTLSVSGCVMHTRYILLKMTEAGVPPIDANCAMGGSYAVCLTALGAKK